MQIPHGMASMAMLSPDLTNFNALAALKNHDLRYPPNTASSDNGPAPPSMSATRAATMRMSSS